MTNRNYHVDHWAYRALGWSLPVIVFVALALIAYAGTRTQKVKCNANNGKYAVVDSITSSCTFYYYGDDR